MPEQSPSGTEWHPSDARPRLTIGYSSLAARVGDIRLPEVDGDTDLVVCVQGSDPGTTPPPGARLVTVPGTGVARSRNAAIDAATGRYLLFCDDDVDVRVPGVLAGIGHLEATGKAMVLGQGVDPSGRPRKSYPSRVTRLTRLNSAKAATYEMLVDVDQVRAAGLRFDERFGAGATLYLGDEYIFVADLLAAGLSGDAIPVVFATHPVASSGSRWGSAEDAHVRAVAVNRVFGRAAPVARVAFAVKNRRSLGGWRRGVAFARNGTRAPGGGGSPPPREAGQRP